jgi:hypothetical protein
MIAWLRRVWWMMRHGTSDSAVTEELEYHRAATQDRLERSGLCTADATAASRRIMGNVTLAREDVRAAWIARWIDALIQDLRYTLRFLCRHPGSSLVLIATPGSAIGLNISVFTTFNAVVLRPWPV